MPFLDMFRTKNQQDAAAERRADAAYEKKIKDLINPDEEYRGITNDEFDIPKWFRNMVHDELPYKADFTVNWPDLVAAIWVELARKLKDLDVYGKSRVNDPELGKLLDEVLEPVKDRFDYFVKRGKARHGENAEIDILEDTKFRTALERIRHGRAFTGRPYSAMPNKDFVPGFKRDMQAALKAIADPEPGQKSKKHIIRKLEKIKESLETEKMKERLKNTESSNIKEAIDVLLDGLAESSNVKSGGSRNTRRNKMKRRTTRRR